MTPAPGTDFSTFHSPIGTLFRCDTQRSPQRTLTPDQIRHFHQHGYVAGVRVLSEEQIAGLRADVESLMQPGLAVSDHWYEYHRNESSDPNSVLFHALGAWRVSVGFHDLLWNQAITHPASQLLDGDVRFWHDQLFCKPAKHGGVVAWHQDYSYWTRTTPMAHLTCWIGLDDSTLDNGCLQYIPGSHRWPLLPATELAGDLDAIRDRLNDQQWECFQNPVAIEMQAGECAFHHPLMLHGSFANNTDQPRRAAVLNFVKDGVQSDTDAPLLANTTAIEQGQPLGGQFFPLLWSAD